MEILLLYILDQCSLQWNPLNIVKEVSDQQRPEIKGSMNKN